MTLIVGVSGVRGIVGDSLTPGVVLEFAQAFGTLLDGGRVVVARDTRPSGPTYAAAATAGLLATGADVVDLGVVMTPSAGYALIRSACAGGLIITASHNPGEWNGLKLLDERGLAPDPQRVAALHAIRAGGRYRMARTGFRPPRLDDQAGERHADAVFDAVEVDPAPLRGLRVVLDSINGAGCLDSPGFLSRFGCDVVHLNGEPTGLFAHGPEPVAENLAQLCDAVREHRAAVGFAQDPDGDRLAIVDERGRFVGEEYTLALSVWSVLARRPGPVAANLSTSRMIDDVAGRFGVRVHRTPVGEAHVARAVAQHGCVIGGEGNGGVIDPRIVPVRDSLSAMSQVLQLLAATGKSVSALVDELPRYVMLKEKVPCGRESAASTLAAVAAHFEGRGGPGLALDRRDGLRVDAPGGWVHVRASNTEPIMRIIAEAADARACRELMLEVKRAAGIA